MQARADDADRYIRNRGQVDDSRTTTMPGTFTPNGQSGRTVDVKIKEIK